jgi:hypothetical protein
MTEVLVEFDTIVRGEDGGRWIPRACGRPADDGLWEGWIEFESTDPTVKPVRTGRETEQHDRGTLLYWAEGLTQIYFEGALKRATATPPVVLRPAEIDVKPAFGGPKPPPVRPSDGEARGGG